MTENKSLLASGLGMVARNKRYIVWFFVLNLCLAAIGTVPFLKQASSVLDDSLLSNRLVHGFDLSVFIGMLIRPEFGPAQSSVAPAIDLAVLFSIATALFLPGVFAGYGSTYRLPRDEFFRACGRNLWRFIRLLLIAGVVMGIVAGILFSIHGALEKKAGDSTNELLVFEVQMSGLAVIFLIMTVLRIWFDLAEADVVLSDQNAVRRSIGSAFLHTFRGLLRLLLSYVVITLVAAIILVAGILAWLKFVPPASVAGAFLISQFTLLLLLIPRFWQRGVAVTYWQQKMLVPVVAYEPIVEKPAPLVMEPIVPPEIPNLPPTPQES